MCLTTLTTYTRQHRVFTFICVVVLVISTLLTLLVHFYGNTREQFVVATDGSQIPIRHIELTSKQMVPDALSIRVGEYVQFNTADKRKHKIGLGGGDEYDAEHEHSTIDFESETYGVNDAYRVRFSEPGVYDFHDHLHSDLFATIIVY